jgi:hypothetical protein
MENPAEKKIGAKQVLLGLVTFVALAIIAAQFESSPTTVTPQGEQAATLAAPTADAGPKSPSYQDMALIDFKLDRRKLLGQKIRLTGVFSVMGSDEMGSLSEKAFDTTPVLVSTKDLSREERKMLLQCQSIECKYEIEGSVVEVLSDVGIEADHMRLLSTAAANP